MFRYADPETCPVCRADMPRFAPRCPTCTTALSGPVAADLYQVLTRADQLLTALTVPAGAGAAVPAGAPEPGTGAGIGTGATDPATPRPELPGAEQPRPEPAGTVRTGLATQAPYPTPRPVGRPAAGAAGLPSSLVPKVLLGLGATCLIVAALVFLAVAWALLGVGGRTAVLIGLTAVSGTFAAWAAGRLLRGTAEAFTALTLALVALDLIGGYVAGWFGDAGPDTLAVVAGAAVAGLATLGAMLARRRGIHLFSADAGIAIGTYSLTIGLVDLLPTGTAGSTTVALAVAAAAAVGVYALRFRLAALLVGSGACFWWLALLGIGMSRIEEPSLAAVWGGLACWPVLVAAAVAALPIAVPQLPVYVRVAGATVAVTLLSALVTLSALDEGPQVVTWTAVAVVVTMGLADLALRRAWVLVILPTTGVAAVLLLVGAIEPLATIASGLLDHGVWTEHLGDRPVASAVDWRDPLRLPVAFVGVVGACWIGLRRYGGWSRTGWLALVGLGSLALLGVLPVAYGAPYALVVPVLLVTGGIAAATTRRRVPELRMAGAATACGLLLGALAVGTAVDWLTLLTTGVLTGVFGWLAHRRDETGIAASVLLPVAVTGFGWTALHLLATPVAWRALPLLAVLCLWVVLRPAVERELAVVGCVVPVAAVAIDAAHGWQADAVVLHLTVAGVLAHLSALRNAERRVLGWVGLGLLVAAQWVKLADLGVGVTEAYTLPLALVLLVVGLLRMRDRTVTSRLALGPGLGLALVPSLLLVLVDPVSGRALLLGAACLALVLVGAAVRWSAPIVAGATVGVLVVLREALHAEVLPQWVTIGLLGVVLTFIGITWERRFGELRTAAGRLRRLR